MPSLSLLRRHVGGFNSQGRDDIGKIPSKNGQWEKTMDQPWKVWGWLIFKQSHGLLILGDACGMFLLLSHEVRGGRDHFRQQIISMAQCLGVFSHFGYWYEVIPTMIHRKTWQISGEWMDLSFNICSIYVPNIFHESFPCISHTFSTSFPCSMDVFHMTNQRQDLPPSTLALLAHLFASAGQSMLCHGAMGWGSFVDGDFRDIYG